MSKALTAILAWAMSSFFARFLTSAGFALLGAMTFTQFIEYFINKAITQLTQVPMIGLLGIAGVDTAISIMISAVMIKLYLSTVVQSMKIVRK